MQVIVRKNANYEETWQIQQLLREDCLKSGNEFLILCEHSPVITYGRLANLENLKVSTNFLKSNSIDIVQTNRGGDFTYHGPGMLVIYPIINIKKRELDCLSWIRKLETLTIKVLDKFDIKAYQIEQKTGVWVLKNNKPLKIASIGIHISRGVSIHGLCLNVKREPPYGLYLINPCGLDSSLYCFMEDFRSVSLDEVILAAQQIFKSNLELYGTHERVIA